MLTIVDDQNLGYALGAADYLTKPIDRERLVAVLEQVPPPPRRPVLVVEDDADAASMLRRMLEQRGLDGGRGGERPRRRWSALRERDARR